MIAFLITLTIDLAKSEAFEKDFEVIRHYVEAEEPGTVAYRMGRSDRGPGIYRLVEVYRDDSALAVHTASGAYGVFKPKLGGASIAPPEVERIVFLD